MSGSPAWHLAASGARQSHPLSPALSGVNSSYFEEEEEEMSLLPPPGTLRNMFMACVRTASVRAWRPPSACAARRTQERRLILCHLNVQATTAAGPPTKSLSATR